MKLNDRFSCSVTFLAQERASAATLSGPRWFGQFGEISSLRVLKDSQPYEIYVRYIAEEEALAALDWCSSQPHRFRSPKHGYTRYCKDFINGQPCSKHDCEHRHSWADTRDILNFSKAFVP